MISQLHLLVLILIGTVGCATSLPTGVPEVELDVLPAFEHSVSVQHFQKGEDVLYIDWRPSPAQAPLTRYRGYWSPDAVTAVTNHGWLIDVFSTHSAKVAAAYEHASSGYEADLDERMDFLTPPQPKSPFENPRRALSYLFARFERKSFRWGHAVSFFSQGVQDTSMPEPTNGRLQYEIFGVTKDGRYTVVARLSPSHPELPDDRDARDMRAGLPDSDPQAGMRRIDALNRRDFPLARRGRAKKRTWSQVDRDM